MKIPYNKPYFGWHEAFNAVRAALGGQFSGNGVFTRRCQAFFEEKFGFGKTLLTTSCSDALEMAAILTGVGPGDEVIMPAYTFMSTPNAFLLRGAKVVFADTLPDIPNIDPASIEALITPRTKVIVVVHYCGIACRMDEIMDIARRHGLLVVEDAAHAIGATYKGRPLGGIGHLGTFSFHETKNIIAGEGGLLIVNDSRFAARAEIIWEKGTNRAAFQRGEVGSYNWVDIGSSFLPAEMVAAFLWAQLQKYDRIQRLRKNVWMRYFATLQPLAAKGQITLPVVPDYASVNGNFFYLLTHTTAERDRLLNHLNRQGIHAVFHYLPLHQSPYFTDKHDGRPLPHTCRFSGSILRLPFYPSLTGRQIDRVCREVEGFLGG